MRSQSSRLQLLSALVISTAALVSAAENLGKSEPQEIRSQIPTPIRVSASCGCCVCFAMDDSGSINMGEWEQQQNFVINLVELHNLFNAGLARYSAVAFNSNARQIVSLTGSVPFFANTITAANPLGGGTNIGRGLAECKSRLSARSCGRRSIVLLSDGFGSVSMTEVQNIKNMGISIITIGIGSSVNPILDDIASNPSCSFRTTFAALRRLPRAEVSSLGPVAPNTCTDPLLTKIAIKFCNSRLARSSRPVPSEDISPAVPLSP